MEGLSAAFSFLPKPPRTWAKARFSSTDESWSSAGDVLVKGPVWLPKSRRFGWHHPWCSMHCGWALQDACG